MFFTNLITKTFSPQNFSICAPAEEPALDLVAAGDIERKYNAAVWLGFELLGVMPDTLHDVRSLFGGEADAEALGLTVDQLKCGRKLFVQQRCGWRSEPALAQLDTADALHGQGSQVLHLVVEANHVESALMVMQAVRVHRVFHGPAVLKGSVRERDREVMMDGLRALRSLPAVKSYIHRSAAGRTGRVTPHFLLG